MFNSNDGRTTRKSIRNESIISSLKKGSGATLLGTGLIVMMFFVGILFISYFDIYNAGIETQTKTDAIADAMAVAASDGTGIPDIDKAAEVMDEMVVKQNDDLNANGKSKISIEQIEFDPVKLLEQKTLTLTTSTVSKNTSMYLLFNEDEQNIVNGKNSTKLVNSRRVDRQLRYPDEPFIATNPEIRHNPNGSFPLSTEEYRKIVAQFDVEITKRYTDMQNRNAEGQLNGISKDAATQLYIWDVTSALGCEIPFFYKQNNGDPWTVNDTQINPNSQEYMPDNRFTNVANVSWNQGPDNNYQNYSKHFLFGWEYIRNVKNTYRSAYPALTNERDYPALNSVNANSKYDKWQTVAYGNMSDAEAERKIQAEANAGYPTVIFFQNGQEWIVIPETRASTGRGMLVSYASGYDDPSTNDYVSNNLQIGYRHISGNYYAITYKP